MLFKEYIAKKLVGDKLHFKCDCLFPIDNIGKIIGYEISEGEILFVVDVDGKIIRIGENHPNLNVNDI